MVQSRLIQWKCILDDLYTSEYTQTHGSSHSATNMSQDQQQRVSLTSRRRNPLSTETGVIKGTRETVSTVHISIESQHEGGVDLGNGYGIPCERKDRTTRRRCRCAKAELDRVRLGTKRRFKYSKTNVAPPAVPHQ